MDMLRVYADKYIRLGEQLANIRIALKFVDANVFVDIDPKVL